MCVHEEVRLVRAEARRRGGAGRVAGLAVVFGGSGSIASVVVKGPAPLSRWAFGLIRGGFGGWKSRARRYDGGMILTLLAASVLQAAAPESRADAPPPQPATWNVQTISAGRYLRATTEGASPHKLMFLCNDERRLVGMAMLASADPQALAGRAAAAGWLVDGAAQGAGGGPAPRPLVTAAELVSLVRLDLETYRRMQSAEAAGIAWLDGAGARIAGFQVEMADGRAPLAAFARECDSEYYR
jgi:hypothetical protein